MEHGRSTPRLRDSTRYFVVADRIICLNRDFIWQTVAWNRLMNLDRFDLA